MKQKIDKIKIEDKKISVAIVSSFVVLAIQYLILIYLDLLNSNTGQVIQIISKAIVGFFYLLAFPIVFKRSKLEFIMVYFISTFIFLINYAIFYENRPYIKGIIFSFFFSCLPSFIFSYSIYDWNILMEVMKKASRIIFFVTTLIGILVFTGKSSIGIYSMTLSYYILFPTIVNLNEFMNKFSIKHGLIVLVSLSIILALGSRGAIMCLGIFIIWKLTRKFQKTKFIEALIYIIIFLFVLLGFLFLNGLLEIINNVFINYGIQSRSINLFLKGEIYLSGRDKIYSDVLDKILDNPLFGIGLAGDRYILNGGYTHNIFLEILAHFGIVIGAFIIIMLLYIIVKSIFIKDNSKYNIVIIWLSIGFVHLLVSSSYLIDFKFWILLGLLINVIINKSNYCRKRETLLI